MLLRSLSFGFVPAFDLPAFCTDSCDLQPLLAVGVCIGSCRGCVRYTGMYFCYFLDFDTLHPDLLEVDTDSPENDTLVIAHGCKVESWCLPCMNVAAYAEQRDRCYS